MDEHPTARLLGGRYRLVRPVGHGGMSEVHLARDEVLDRDVAVKLVRADRVDGPDGVARLEREARATAGLRHANVVTVHDVLRDGDDAAIVMELVRGETLADRLRREGSLPWPEAVTIAGRIAGGLGAAHAVGLVHRDVKPSNVLLGEDGALRVADFGIAGAVDASTQTASVRGSIPYLAPEQARGERPDPRTDVYALGCVLHEMLTGDPPFRDDTGAAIIGQHLHRAPSPPSERVADVPAALDATVLRMLAKEPDARHPDMAAVAADLERLLADPGGAPTTAVLPTAAVPTAPVAPTATSGRPQAGPTRRPGRAPMLLGLGGALVVLLVLLGLRMLDSGAPPADASSEAATSPTPAASAAPTTTTSATEPTASEPTPTEARSSAAPTRPETVEEVAAAYRRELVAGRDDGQASGKAVEELDKLVTEIVQKDREDKPKDVRDKARELDDKTAEMVEKGELTASLADMLDDVAQQFLRVA